MPFTAVFNVLVSFGLLVYFCFTVIFKQITGTSLVMKCSFFLLEQDLAFQIDEFLHLMDLVDTETIRTSLKTANQPIVKMAYVCLQS